MGDKLLSALTAGVLSLGWPKESSQRKGHPRVDARLRRVPCATRRAGRLWNSGLRPSNSPRRLPPARLRCSASSMGTRNTERNAQRGRANFPLVCRAPWEALSNAGLDGGVGEHCPKGRRSRPKLRSPRPSRVAQGTGQRPAPTQGRLFFAYFLLAKQKKVRRASGAETNVSANPPA